MINFDSIDELKFDQLSINFDDGAKVFDEVSFDFPLNEIVWVRNPGAPGKSVLLKLLSGILLPTEGNYIVNGHAINNLSFSEFAEPRLKIGYSFDYGGLINNRTLFDNLMLPLQYHDNLTRSEAIERVMEYMSLFCLEDEKDKRPSAVPGGVRKAAVVARSLIMQPVLLLLDEPTTGLRNKPRESLMKYLTAYHATGHIKHIFFSSQDRKFVDRVATQVLDIDRTGFKTYSYQDWKQKEAS